MPRTTVCLWFDHEGEEAAEFYTALFPNSRITDVARYGEAGPGEPGTALTVSFELDGRPFTALNGGPAHAGFTETISLQIDCADQAEVDHYWDALSADGGREDPCGWVRDKFGLFWQVVPTRLPELLTDPDQEAAQRAMQAMLQMRRLDIAELEAAFTG